MNKKSIYTILVTNGLLLLLLFSGILFLYKCRPQPLDISHQDVASKIQNCKSIDLVKDFAIDLDKENRSLRRIKNNFIDGSIDALIILLIIPAVTVIAGFLALKSNRTPRG